MFLGRDRCAFSWRPSRLSFSNHQLSLLRPTYSIHSRATSFRVNTYAKHRGVPLASSAVIVGSRLVAHHCSCSPLATSHSPLIVFFCIFRTTTRASADFLDTYAFCTEKHPGEGGLRFFTSRESPVTKHASRLPARHPSLATSPTIQVAPVSDAQPTICGRWLDCQCRPQPCRCRRTQAGGQPEQWPSL
jgi:hypothetical protein